MPISIIRKLLAILLFIYSKPILFNIIFYKKFKNGECVDSGNCTTRILTVYHKFFVANMDKTLACCI